MRPWKIVVQIIFILIIIPQLTYATTFYEVLNVDFNSDSPGFPPETGGINQPFNLTTLAGTSISVQSSANGINSQPVVLSWDEQLEYVSVDVQFNPVSFGTVRVEATVAFDKLIDGFFLQTSVPSAAVTRLVVTSSGEIQDSENRLKVGEYSPNQPFRVRMDINMSAKNWSVAIDSNLNGFIDDPVYSELLFTNTPDNTPSVSNVHASFNGFPVNFMGGTVAYDDIRVYFECTDDDGDGFATEGGSCGETDCDDTNFLINPSATEICDDTIDNDCDSQSDCSDNNCSGDPVCTSDSGGGCSIAGVKMSIEDALAGYGLLIVAGVLLMIRRRRKGK